MITTDEVYCYVYATVVLEFRGWYRNPCLAERSYEVIGTVFTKKGRIVFQFVALDFCSFRLIENLLLLCKTGQR